MADAITIQELIDARTDAKTLEEAVNGDAVTTVLSRLGETYPTLSNALNQIDSKLDSADTQIKQGITNLFENGGLPATPFATKALMAASALVDGDYAMVTNDTVNNGLYVKTAGAWVKSSYDPVEQAITSASATYRNNWYFNVLKIEATGDFLYVQIKGATSSLSSGAFYGRGTYSKGEFTVAIQAVLDAVAAAEKELVTSPRLGLTGCFELNKFEGLFFDEKALTFRIANREIINSAASRGLVCLFANNSGEATTGLMKAVAATKILETERQIALTFGTDSTAERVQMIASSKGSTSPSTGFYVNYNSTTKILNIPYDTIFYHKASRYIVPLGGIQVDCGVSGSANRIFWDKRDDSIISRPYTWFPTTADKPFLVYLGSIRDVGLAGGGFSTTPSNIQMDWCGTYYIDDYRLGIRSTNITENRLTDFVKGVAHRGYSKVAPENTLPAYILAKKMGFSYVETDILFTSDDIPVLLHDATINRTSDGIGTIASMTLAEAKTYDFGSWKSAEYAGTQIPTLREFLDLCRALTLHPYLELKNTNEAKAATIVQVVKDARMEKDVTYICFTVPALQEVVRLSPTARIGFLGDPVNATVDTAETLKNETNEVFVNINGTPAQTAAMVSYAATKDMNVEVWTVNNAATALEHIEGGVRGISTDTLNIRELINNKYLL